MTDELKRSGGITAAAVIALVGSVGALLSGSLTVFGGLLATQDPSLAVAPGDPALPPLAMFVAIGGSQLALSVWGIVSAVGLLRLRNWARLSFVVFAAMLTAFMSCAALGLLVAIPVLTLAPSVNPDVQPGVTVAIVLVTLPVLAGLATGIWWLIYFNRASVRSRFADARAATSEPLVRLPIRIAVIGWLLIASALTIPLQLVNTYPLVLFGFVIDGGAGRAVAVAMATVGLATGIGLLRRRAGAHILAVAIYVMGLLNLAVTYGIPGGPARVRETYQKVFTAEGLPDTFVAWAVWGGIIWGVLISVLFLWLLMSRRQAFLRACLPAPRTPDLLA